MAIDTRVTLRNETMYCIFVRQFTPEGTFAAAERELDRVKALGTDIIWLMPIHPIGKVQRKGSLGSPYANQDYRAVNPEFGTLEDFIHLTEEIHRRGMKVIIDVVYNHTSPDSVLVKEHPEWFYHKADGSFGNHVGDWTDIIDLDYTQKGLWRYQIDTLKYWAQWVDGFRCDVAPMVPVAFWAQAREEVAQVRPGALWLSESVQPMFHDHMRSLGLTSYSDGEEYQAFDMTYEYDIYDDWLEALESQAGLDNYLHRLNLQEGQYPANYVKLRFLENHDRSRAAFLIPNREERLNWTAFNAFKNGIMLIYNGQEFSAVNKPSLFDRDTMERDGEDISRVLTKLSELRRDELFAKGVFHCVSMGDGIVYAERRFGEDRLAGIFCLRGKKRSIRVPLAEGVYTDLFTGKSLRCEEGRMSTEGNPVIFRAKGSMGFFG